MIKPLLWLLNRNDLENLSPGDTLIVPTHFGLDFRAYSPFPRYYPGASDLDKIVILDKNVQAWGAYERGELARWGIINTGVESARTPSGRFNVNWKQEDRISTLSPGYGSNDPDAELWRMLWVMNLHEARGIHMHQYALPASGPASHGCIRMLEPDAMWLYEWTDTWTVEGQRDPISSVGAKIVDQGTMVLIIGEDISESPPAVPPPRAVPGDPDGEPAAGPVLGPRRDGPAARLRPPGRPPLDLPPRWRKLSASGQTPRPDACPRPPTRSAPASRSRRVGRAARWPCWWARS